MYEDRADAATIKKVQELETRLGWDPGDLAHIIDFESAKTWKPWIAAGGKDFRTLNHDQQDRVAVGLIQALKRTREGLGFTGIQVAEMTGPEQLERIVLPYFMQFPQRLERILRMQTHHLRLASRYMLVLYPVAALKPLDWILPMRAREYAANRGLDLSHDGMISKREASARVCLRAGIGREGG